MTDDAPADRAPVRQPTPQNLDRAAGALADGELVVVPSDSNLGIAVDPRNADAVDRVYDVKGRDRSKALTIAVHDPAAWRPFGATPHDDLVDSLIDAVWPGPLNLVLDATDRVPEPPLAGKDTVAVACFEHPTYRAFVRRTGPVAITSANRSGEADDRLVDVAMAREHVGHAVDCILDGEAPQCTQSTTIVDCSAAGGPSILRRGDLTADDLNALVDGEPF